jgi:hypothetical protein
LVEAKAPRDPRRADSLDREREALVKHQGDDALDDSAAARLGVRGLQRRIGLRPLAVA